MHAATSKPAGTRIRARRGFIVVDIEEGLVQ
jgi:hypothetical protein